MNTRTKNMTNNIKNVKSNIGLINSRESPLHVQFPFPSTDPSQAPAVSRCILQLGQFPSSQLHLQQNKFLFEKSNIQGILSIVEVKLEKSKGNFQSVPFTVRGRSSCRQAMQRQAAYIASWFLPLIDFRSSTFLYISLARSCRVQAKV